MSTYTTHSSMPSEESIASAMMELSEVDSAPCFIDTSDAKEEMALAISERTELIVPSNEVCLS
eukprot:m.125121 g.125121  ORF g.125121 m.125121 type:complete len:63 (+) comp12974_c0_seq6:218-406(+)